MFSPQIPVKSIKKKKKKRVKPRTSEFFSNFRQYEIIKLFLEP